LDASHERFAKEIRVLGVWSDGDTRGFLDRMFILENLLGSNFHRIVPTQDFAAQNHGGLNFPPPGTAPIHLHNLGQVLTEFDYKQFNPPPFDRAREGVYPFIPDASLEDEKNAEYFGTTRVVRIFNRSANRLEQFSRIDWEISPKRMDGPTPAWLPLNDEADRDRAAKLLSQLLALDRAPAPSDAPIESEPPFDAVIIKDNGKGVVSSSLIELLVGHKDFSFLNLRTVPWFVQTKQWEPPYVQYLRNNVLLRLLVYQSVALKMSHVATWTTAQHRVTPDAVQALKRIAGCDNGAGVELCVVLPGHLSAIALHVKEGKQQLIYQPTDNPNRVPLEGAMGSATATFASLVYGLLQPKGMIAPRYLIDGSLRVAQRWASMEHKRLMQAEVPTAPKELVLSVLLPNEAEGEEGIEGARTERTIGLLVPSKSDGALALKADDLEDVDKISTCPDVQDEVGRWDASSDGCGVIEGNGECYIELSRSMIELRNFVCCAKHRRQQIAELMNYLKSFDIQHSRRSMSALLMAKPGSGKTQLVKSLARDLGFQLLSYNITNLLRIEDLLLSFDQVVALN
jgi:hypothetical protein